MGWNGDNQVWEDEKSHVYDKIRKESGESEESQARRDAGATSLKCSPSCVIMYG